MSVKISALPAIVTPALTDVFPVVQGGITYKETITQLSTLFGLNGTASAVLITDSGGTPSLSTTLPSGIAATSMVLTTPKVITSILDTNSNTLLGISATASAVDYVNITNASTGTQPIIAAAGSDTNISLTINSKGSGGIYIKGQTDGSLAPVGYVGEIISSSIPIGSAVSMTTATATDITSISLTAGAWLVWGNVVLTSSGTALQIAIGWISTTSATTPDSSLYSGINNTSNTNAATYINCLPKPINISSTTTVYLSGYATFGAGTMTGCGNIYAMRVR